MAKFVAKSCTTCGLKDVCTLIKGRPQVSRMGGNAPWNMAGGQPLAIPYAFLPMPCGGNAWKPQGEPSGEVTRFFEEYAPASASPLDTSPRGDADASARGDADASARDYADLDDKGLPR